jgi:hypothetical protein
MLTADVVNTNYNVRENNSTVIHINKSYAQSKRNKENILCK